MCDNTNTTDLDDKFPQCGAVGCEHVKCARCAQLTDEDEEDEEDEEGIRYSGEVGYWWGIVAALSGRAPPQVDPRARWYCVSVIEEDLETDGCLECWLIFEQHMCGNGPASTNTTTYCRICGHTMCAYCRVE